MNRQAQIRKLQAHISQPQKDRVVFCHADRERLLCVSPSTPPPGNRSFAWLGERHAEMRTVWHAHSLLLQPGKWQTTKCSSTAVRLQGRPYIAAHQQCVSIERRFSRIFPAHLRSLARCWSRARRRFDVLLQALRVWVSNNKFPAQRTRWKFLAGPSTESTSRPWERGTLASLRARVSRRQSGQIQTGEKQWHSTETTSR